MELADQHEKARLAKIQEENPSKTDYAAACARHLQECVRFTEAHDLNLIAGRMAYVDAVNKGSVDLPDWVWKLKANVSRRSLERWGMKAREGGMAALDPKWENAGRKSVLRASGEHTGYILALLQQRPHLASRRLWQGLKARFGDTVPGVDAVSRFIKAWKEDHAEEYLRMLNPDKAKNKFQVAFGSRSANVVRLNQLWETDATPADIVFTGDKRRYTICQAVDVFSDRHRFLLTATPKGLAHGLLFRDCILAWGLPEVIKTDNGKDYTSAYMTRVFSDLGIEQVLCRPFSGEEKPHVERGFGTFLHDLVELLPGYTGHNVAQAQDIRSQKTFADRLKEAKKGDVVEAGMTKEEFESFMVRWCLAEDHRERTSGRLKGKAPAQKVDEWAAEHRVRRVADARSLDCILLPAFPKTVQKKGIRHENRYYIAPELGEMVGLPVEIRQSPEDAGRVLVYKDGAFLFLAEDPDLTGVSRAEIAAKAHAHQKAKGQAEREVQRELRKHVRPQAVVEEILQDRLRGVDPVSTFQVPEFVETAALAASVAAKAADALAERAKAVALPPAIRPLDMSPEQELAIRAQYAKAKPEEPFDRYMRLIRQPLRTPEDQDWVDFYETTPEGLYLRNLLTSEQAKKAH